MPPLLRVVKNRHFLAVDAFTVFTASLLAFLVRFEGYEWMLGHVGLIAIYVGLSLPLRIVVFYFAGMYRRLWRHASVGELRQIVVAGVAAGFVCAFVGLVYIPVLDLAPSRVPFSVVFLDGLLTIAAVAYPRLLARAGKGKSKRRRNDRFKPVLIVGAGDAAKNVAKDLLASPDSEFDPVGYVDDDRLKHGQTLAGLPVLGPISAIRSLVEKLRISQLVVAMPSAPGPLVREVFRAGLDCGIPTLTVPSVADLMTKKGAAPGLREIEIQDLLRRDPIVTDLAAVATLATGETVLVTGAGGSIGAELCRQIARLAPARLVLLGHGENSIFDIRYELRRDYPEVPLVSVIADVRDRDRMFWVFQMYRPHAVFHAAAHKHVPLMEDNVVEAVTNNVIGTRNVVDASVEAGVDHFVLISTDKAVRPTSVMGATKRVAEMIVQYAATRYERNFVAVRFGNVLGSRGSVVPTFIQQIREGGPVTVTHPEMQRYFITISESVQLVLQAGALGQGGEVFLLDMGEPIRIADIAADLIKLSGFNVGTDIEIRFTGMRAGEKLYEEMFFSGEHVLSTDHPKVLRARNGILSEGMNKRIDILVAAAHSGETDDGLRALLGELVPDFHAYGTSERPTTPVAKSSATHRRLASQPWVDTEARSNFRGA
jgi:FlaA1/EpsC-like NDP-sugar epimerase